MLLFVSNAFTQNYFGFCGSDLYHRTDGFKAPDPIDLNLCESLTKTDKSFLKLYIVLIQDDNGNGPSSDAAKVIYQSVNEHFSPHHIFFQRGDQEVTIKNSALKNNPSGNSQTTQLFSLCRQEFDQDDGIILYVFDDQSLPNITWAGVAANLESRHSILRVDPNDYEALTKVAIHEIGHNLGLAHTFHDNILSFYDLVNQHGGVVLSEPHSTSMELFNDPLCAERGDNICDTPSDPGWRTPFHYNEETCLVDADVNYWKNEIESTYTFKINDSLFIPIMGVHYSLNTQGFEFNHMSYNYRHCRNQFTTEQANVMNCTANNKPLVYDAALSYDPIIVETNQDLTYTDEYLENHIIIKSGGELTLNGDIKLPYWAQIIVKPGGKLFIDNATLSGYLDDDFWSGIVVLGDFSLTNSGFVSINNSIIKNARKGIHSKNGGRYALIGSTFLNNMIAVHQDSSAKVNLSKIENCSFITDEMPNDYAWHMLDATGEEVILENTYNEQYSHSEFILLENTNSFPIKDSYFNTVDGWSTGNHGFGIILNNSDAGIYNNIFENQNAAIIQVNNLRKGLSNIKSNEFIDNIIGIQLIDSCLSSIEDNSFQIPSPSTVFSNYTFGVKMDTLVDGVDILKNNFTSSVSADVHYITADSSNSQLSNNIRYNNFGSPSVSAYRHIELHGNHTMLQIGCNEFEIDNATEFAVGLEDLSELMDQGDLDRPAGNKWSNLDTCNQSNDSQLYKKSSASGFEYYSHRNTEPKCISNGIYINTNLNDEPQAYCDAPNSEPCIFPCRITEVAAIGEDIRLINSDPNLPQPAKVETIQPLMHNALKIAQRDLIQLITEQDSLQDALSYLDSLVLILPEHNAVWSTLIERYTQNPIMMMAENQGNKETSTYQNQLGNLNDFRPLIFNGKQGETKQKPVEDKFSNIQLLVYPNPAQHDLNISIIRNMNQEISTLATIQLLDITGKVVHEHRLARNQSESVINLPTRLFGLYLVVYKDDLGHQVFERVLIKP